LLAFGCIEQHSTELKLIDIIADKLEEKSSRQLQTELQKRQILEEKMKKKQERKLKAKKLKVRPIYLCIMYDHAVGYQ
jgi:hypothetical protein